MKNINQKSVSHLLTRVKHLRGRHDQLDHAWNRGMGQGGYGAGLAPNQMGPLPTESFYRKRLTDLTEQRRRGEITRAEMRRQMRDLRGITNGEADTLVLANTDKPKKYEAKVGTPSDLAPRPIDASEFKPGGLFYKIILENLSEDQKAIIKSGGENYLTQSVVDNFYRKQLFGKLNMMTGNIFDLPEFALIQSKDLLLKMLAANLFNYKNTSEYESLNKRINLIKQAQNLSVNTNINIGGPESPINSLISNAIYRRYSLFWGKLFSNTQFSNKFLENLTLSDKFHEDYLSLYYEYLQDELKFRDKHFGDSRFDDVHPTMALSNLGISNEMQDLREYYKRKFQDLVKSAYPEYQPNTYYDSMTESEFIEKQSEIFWPISTYAFSTESAALAFDESFGVDREKYAQNLKKIYELSKKDFVELGKEQIRKYIKQNTDDYFEFLASLESKDFNIGRNDIALFLSSVVPENKVDEDVKNAFIDLKNANNDIKYFNMYAHNKSEYLNSRDIQQKREHSAELDRILTIHENNPDAPMLPLLYQRFSDALKEVYKFNANKKINEEFKKNLSLINKDDVLSQLYATIRKNSENVLRDYISNSNDFFVGDLLKTNDVSLEADIFPEENFDKILSEFDKKISALEKSDFQSSVDEYAKEAIRVVLEEPRQYGTHMRDIGSELIRMQYPGKNIDEIQGLLGIIYQMQQYNGKPNVLPVSEIVNPQNSVLTDVDGNPLVFYRSVHPYAKSGYDDNGMYVTLQSLSGADIQNELRYGETHWPGVGVSGYGTYMKTQNLFNDHVDESYFDFSKPGSKEYAQQGVTAIENAVSQIKKAYLNLDSEFQSKLDLISRFDEKLDQIENFLSGIKSDLKARRNYFPNADFYHKVSGITDAFSLMFDRQFFDFYKNQPVYKEFEKTLYQSLLRAQSATSRFKANPHPNRKEVQKVIIENIRNSYGKTTAAFTVNANANVPPFMIHNNGGGVSSLRATDNTEAFENEFKRIYPNLQIKDIGLKMAIMGWDMYFCHLGNYSTNAVILNRGILNMSDISVGPDEDILDLTE